MIALFSVFLAVSLAVCFWLFKGKKPKREAEKQNEINAEIINFLNYDGSEQ